VVIGRPTRLKEYWDHVTIPPVPFSVSWEWAPELVRLSLGTLHGVQPVTRTMFEIAGGTLLTEPTDAEVDYFRRKQTQFQMIHLVMSLAWWEETHGVVSAVPFAISALPATKRGVPSSVDIDSVAALRGAPIRPEADFVYSGFDPFRGNWSLAWRGTNYIAENRGKMPLDEVGIAIERYFLALDFDREEVVEFDSFVADEMSGRGYLLNRIRKLFTPFAGLECRRIWGVESPEELFLLQELLFRGLRPECQYLVYPNGTCYPSLYDVYADIEFRRGMNILTEADFFFKASLTPARSRRSAPAPG
jgi:hypothetical protein